MRVYIAGPMTGHPDLNYRAFFDAEAQLQAVGLDTLNPATNEGAGWLDFMRAALRQLAEADGVALLPGWQASRGATIENNLARSLGLDVRPLEEWLHEDQDTAHTEATPRRDAEEQVRHQ